MKNLFTSTALVTAILFNFSAYAEMNKETTSPQPTIQQPAIEIMTIEQVQGLGDNTPVILEGMIIQSIGNEKYTFQDSSGATIMVEIDNEDWNKIKPGPQDMVIITGETDKNGNLMEIDVETIAMKQ